MDSNIIPPTTHHPLPLTHNHLPPTSAPQIRSRITVVCAECKRLKLKCDRRNPCGSCTKRDTVARCIYSPAAAEKVDLHSLNNRLIQVESALALITSGQTPPVFQSSYPYSQILTLNNASSNINPAANLSRSPAQPFGSQHQHHHHHAAPPGPSTTSISVSLQDISSIWLDELDSASSSLDLNWRHSPLMSQINPVKLEGPLESELTHHAMDTASDCSSPGTSTTLPSIDSHNPQLYLPSLGIYYSSTALPRCPPSQPHLYNPAEPDARSQTLLFPPSGPTSSKPSVTPALVALLPPVSRAKHFLQKAVQLLRVMPVPALSCLLGPSSEETDGDGIPGGRLNGKNDGKGNRKGKGKACLPSLATRWDAFELRALCLIGGRGLSSGTSTKTDRKEREKVSARAREIFFGNGTPSMTNVPALNVLARQRKENENVKHNSVDDGDPSERNVRDRGHSLPFFAAVCVALALGVMWSTEEQGESQLPTPMQTPTREETETSAFFYALARQALCVWETSATLTCGDDKEAGKTENANEEERLDYLVASLLSVGYLLLESSLGTCRKNKERQKRKGLGVVFPLVGKMVNVARAMGLGKDRKLSTRCKEDGIGKHKSGKKDISEGKDGKKRGKAWERRRRKDELRRLIWWDIVFYDLFVSDVLGHPSLVPALSYSTKLPRIAASSLFVNEIESDEEDRQDPLGNDRGENDDDDDDSCDMLEKYHGARCRLTKITHMIQHRLVQSDCCCGYTLDQAATLEGEIRRFLASLPSALRFSVTEDEAKIDAYHFLAPNGDKAILQMQSCELALMAQRLIIMIYLPFLRLSSSSPAHAPTTVTANDDSQSHGAESRAYKGSHSSWNPALQPIVGAAQCIIRVAQVLMQLVAVKPGCPDSLHVLPSFLDLYPVEKALLDAVIICTHASTIHATLFACNNVAGSAVTGMEMLCDLDVGPECKRSFDRLRKKFHTTSSVVETKNTPVHGLKRRHDQLDGIRDDAFTTTLAKHGSHTFVESNIELGQTNLQQNQPQYLPERRNALDPSVGTRTNVDRTTSDRNSETGEKARKHAKKSHPYPPIGIRVRPGKDVLLRPRADSSPISVSTTSGEGKIQQQERGAQLSLSLMTPIPKFDGHQHGQLMSPQSEGGYELRQQAPSMDAAQPVMSSLLHDSPYRSRSSSLNQDPRVHSHTQHETVHAMEFTVPFGSSDSSSQLNSDRRFSLFEHGQQQLLSSHQQTYVPAVSKYDLTSRPGSYDTGKERNSFDHGQPHHQPSGTVESSPYGNATGQLSSTSSSPYITNGNAMPSPTPTLGPIAQSMMSHQAATSTYTQGLSASANPNPHHYYHMNSNPSFDSAYAHGQGQEHVNSYPNLDVESTSGTLNATPSTTHVGGASVDARRVVASVPGTPVYEKGQSVMFDVKPPMENLVQQHIQHQQILPQESAYGVDRGQVHSHQHTAPITQPEQAWPPPLPPPPQHLASQRFWAPTAGDYKYYQ
ncbi:hypothetical protein AX17_001702 [Amanita inopinata Kibby_2008]|nr:hypothetical protein AX17_001702 [Amanita inopinata Kibby_2008]